MKYAKYAAAIILALLLAPAFGVSVGMLLFYAGHILAVAAAIIAVLWFCRQCLYWLEEAVIAFFSWIDRKRELRRLRKETSRGSPTSSVWPAFCDAQVKVSSRRVGAWCRPASIHKSD